MDKKMGAIVSSTAARSRIGLAELDYLSANFARSHHFLETLIGRANRGTTRKLNRSSESSGRAGVLLPRRYRQFKMTQPPARSAFFLRVLLQFR